MSTKTATKATENTETVSEEVVTEEKEVSPIPAALNSNPILVSFCQQYLDVIAPITEYNNSIFKKSNSEWDRHKLLAEAKKLGSPMDANEEAVPAIKEAFEVYENVLASLAVVRADLVNITAKHLGVSLETLGGERDETKEADLKEKRKFAFGLGETLKQMALYSADKASSEAVNKFLKNNELPAVGRQQTTSFTTESTTATPKYRVKVTVAKEGHTIGEFDGFSKTAIAMTGAAYGYPKGEALKADKLRQAWEAAGNGPSSTVNPTVEFEDNGLTFTLTQK
jgi:hypothetical protein